MVRIQRAIRMRYIITSLSVASLAIQARDYVTALNALQEARLHAHELRSIKGRVIATKCIVAQHAIMPYLTGL